MASAAIAGLQRKFSEVPMTIDTVKLSEREAYGTGCGINLIGYSTSQNLYGSSSLGSKGVAAEKVGEDAGVKLIKMIEDGGCVDEFIQDQVGNIEGKRMSLVH